jgi:hypothetical protein
VTLSPRSLSKSWNTQRLRHLFPGKQGTFTTSAGLRIAFFGGDFDLDRFTQGDADQGEPLSNPYFSSSSLADFLASLNPSKNPIDLLLTYSFPTQVTHLSRKPPAATDSHLTWGAPAASQILAASRPRYHFSASQSIFWEREPFTWPEMGGGHGGSNVTRFLSLGKFGNKDKQRWFYAFNIKPGDIGGPIPAESTPCPITLPQGPGPSMRLGKRDFRDDDGEVPNFIFGDRKRGRNGAAPEGRPPPDNYVCRICVSTLEWQLLRVGGVGLNSLGSRTCQVTGSRNALKGVRIEIGGMALLAKRLDVSVAPV